MLSAGLAFLALLLDCFSRVDHVRVSSLVGAAQPLVTIAACAELLSLIMDGRWEENSGGEDRVRKPGNMSRRQSISRKGTEIQMRRSRRTQQVYHIVE